MSALPAVLKVLAGDNEPHARIIKHTGKKLAPLLATELRDVYSDRRLYNNQQILKPLLRSIERIGDPQPLNILVDGYSSGPKGSDTLTNKTVLSLISSSTYITVGIISAATIFEERALRKMDELDPDWGHSQAAKDAVPVILRNQIARWRCGRGIGHLLELGHIGDEAIVTSLLPMIWLNPHEIVRPLDVLRPGWRQSDGPSLLPELLRMLGDPELSYWRYGIKIAEAIAHIGDKGAVIPLVKDADYKWVDYERSNYYPKRAGVFIDCIKADLQAIKVLVTQEEQAARPHDWSDPQKLLSRSTTYWFSLIQREALHGNTGATPDFRI